MILQVGHAFFVLAWFLTLLVERFWGRCRDFEAEVRNLELGLCQVLEAESLKDLHFVVRNPSFDSSSGFLCRAFFRKAAPGGALLDWVHGSESNLRKQVIDPYEDKRH